MPIHRQGDFLCAGRPPATAREMCEDFAPRNGATRVSGERGANRARKPKTKGSRGVEREPCRPAGLQPRNSRPEVRARKPKTKGSRGVEREPCRPAGLQSRNSCPEVRARKPKIKGLRGVEREPCRPAGLQPRNSRPEVRARKPKTKGLRGVEREPCQPQGSLCLPEAPSPCRPGGPIPLPEGPSHFRRTPKKTPGGSPVFTPILLILSSLLFQRTQVDSLESFQVRFQQWKHF